MRSWGTRQRCPSWVGTLSVTENGSYGEECTENRDLYNMPCLYQRADLTLTSLDAGDSGRIIPTWPQFGLFSSIFKVVNDDESILNPVVVVFA